MVTCGLHVRLEAKAGHEMDVENMLREALPLADEEVKTLAWYHRDAIDVGDVVRVERRTPVEHDAGNRCVSARVVREPGT